MANIIIGSARIDEKGGICNGQSGDQKQIAKPDYRGEVALENFYVHSLGWYILRAKDNKIANKIAAAMETACNNPNIGYDQYQRYGIVTNGTASTVKTEADCSSTVRVCVKEASGIDPGDFNTANEVTVLEKTGLFRTHFAYENGTTLYTGDILVTKSKGHTVVVVKGEPREELNSSATSTNNICYQVEITATALNVRKGAGTKYDIVSTLKQGDVVSIIKEKDGWGKTESGKWISLTYTKKLTTEYKVRINTTALNVRRGPGAEYAKETIVYNGEIYTIVETENGWGKLLSGAGWINLSYTKKL